MKRLIKLIIPITLVFLVLTLVIYYIVDAHFKAENGMRTVVMNRITQDVQSELTDSSVNNIALEDIEETLRGEYTSRAIPDDVTFIPVDKPLAEESVNDTEYSSEYIESLSDSDGKLIGFIKYSYKTRDEGFVLGVAEIILIISYFSIIVGLIVAYNKVLKPFNDLSEYPKKLARGSVSEGLPESKSRFFGEYIWGMNMLKDEMKHKDMNLSQMEREKQTLIISIAHGIKTPLSNIKLYAQAIERGIYHDDKTPNSKDAESAAKIEQNVEKVEALVKEIMDKSARVDVDYQTKVDAFYLEELEKQVRKEYEGRTNLLHIPYQVVLENNPLVNSDKDGIFTIISQLVENAIKYGSGQGITVTMGRQDEDVIISVKNKGTVLSEEETAYVFKSFWRGSNAKDVEGQGIGLYVSKKMAESLGGDLFMKSWESEGITEVTLILPLEA